MLLMSDTVFSAVDQSTVTKEAAVEDESRQSLAPVNFYLILC